MGRGAARAWAQAKVVEDKEHPEDGGGTDGGQSDLDHTTDCKIVFVPVPSVFLVDKARTPEQLGRGCQPEKEIVREEQNN